MKLIRTTKHHHPNLSTEEMTTLKALSARKDIAIQSADKGGKVVVMNNTTYINACREQLKNT